MITEKQIAPAANRYMADVFNSGQRDNYSWSYIDFTNGATWAFEQMKAENAAAIEKDIRQYDRITAVEAENERLRGENERLTNEVRDWLNAYHAERREIVRLRSAIISASDLILGENATHQALEMLKFALEK